MNKVVVQSFLGLFFAGVFLLSLSHCGSSSGGELVIFGRLQQTGVINTTLRTDGGEAPIANALVEGLGQSTTTDENGEFFLPGDRDNLPAETILFITLPTTRNERETVVIDTTGDAPIEVTLTRDQNGNYTFTLAGGSEQESGIINPTPTPTFDEDLGFTGPEPGFSGPEPEPSATATPFDTGSPTPTPSDTCNNFDNQIGGLNSECPSEIPYCALSDVCVECLVNEHCEAPRSCIGFACIIDPLTTPSPSLEPTSVPTIEATPDIPLFATGGVIVSNDGCGVGNYDVAAGGGDNLQISNFGSNNEFGVGFNGTDSFSTSGLDILGFPDHTCTFLFNGSSAMVSCTNPQGGFCQSMGTFGSGICDGAGAAVVDSGSFATCP